MKYFYGINKTNDVNNTKIDGKEFSTRSVSDSYIKERDGIIEAISDKIGLKSLTISKTKSFIFSLSLLVSICGIIAVIRAFAGNDDAFVSSKDLLGKQVWLPIVTLLSLGYFFFFLVKLVQSVKSVNYDSAYDEFKRLNELNDKVMRDMKVPEDSLSIDIFSADYKDGGFIKNPDGCDFANYSIRLYTEGESLCIFDGENIFEFKFSELVKIHTVNEKVILFKWNKETPFESEEWSEYKVSDEKNACISIPTYHILEVSRNGASWGIYFGNYDLEQIEKLTNLKA